MANSYTPDGTLAILVGDGGLRSVPSPTKINNDKVNACIEAQTTTRAPLFLKPMTDAQITAVPNKTDGMVFFSSNSKSLVVYGNGASASGMLSKAATLTAANVQGMRAAPIAVLPAPGVGFSYVVHRLRLSIAYNAAFTGGGAIKLQYGNAASAAGQAAAATVAETFLTAAAASQSITTVCASDGAEILSADTDNQVLTLSNATAAFATGGTSTLTYQVWYSIVAT